MENKTYKIFDENLNLVEVEGDPLEHLDVPPQIMRIITYDIAQQLNFLFDDIQSGLFGEAAKTGKFAAYVQAIKTQFPK